MTTPPADPRPIRVHHYRPPEVWALIRAGWEAGETASAMARAHDVGTSTVLRRSRREGWVRTLPPRPVAPAEARPLRGPLEVAEAALASASEALQRGRHAEVAAILKAADVLEAYADYVTRLREELAVERAAEAKLEAEGPDA